MKSLAELEKLTADSAKDVLSTVNAIVDEYSFVESDKFIGSETSVGYASGEGVISGLATINDVQVGIFAVNGKTLMGSIGSKNAVKISKCVNNAVKMSAPVIGIIDTAGARFAEGIEALEGYSEIVKAFSEAYGLVPTFLVVKGNNFGMLSYLPAFCDFTICYDKSVTATSSPLILAAQTTADVNKVGTATIMAENGVSSFTVASDAELKCKIANLIDLITLPIVEPEDDGNRTADLNNATPVCDVIANVFDAGSFIEIKKDYATEVITGMARLNGIAVGVVANNPECNDGRLTGDGASKITDLVNTLESFGMPLVNLVNSKGAVNCLKCQPMLIKSIGEMMYALNISSITKVAVVTGSAIGVSYVALANKNVYDYVVAWENAQIGMLDSKQSAELVYSKEIGEAENREEAKAKFAEAYEEENSSALVVARKGYIDNVIDPAFTRQYLIAGVQAFFNKR